MSSVRNVVERYNLQLWNQQKYDIAPEIIGDRIVRNSPGGQVILSRDEAVERIQDTWRMFDHLEFTLLHTIVDGDLCAIVYQAETRAADGTRDAIASIEVFRVQDGRIVEVWNNSHDHDRWPDAEDATK